MQLLSELAWWRPSSVATYLNSGSIVYACFIHGSKAFDTVNRRVLFDKLLSTGMPKPLIHLLLQWYKSQKLWVRWMSRISSYLQVSIVWGSKSILFTIYMDSLRISQGQGRGCFLNTHFAGAFCYADDLTILAPSPDALRKMTAECESFVESHGLRFNGTKTQLICML